jgi:hypothetical protein
VDKTDTLNLNNVCDPLAELMLYIAKRNALNPNFGATLLNKILFYSDFIAYRDTGKSITGASYMRLDQGPVPKALIPVREKLLKASEAVVEERHLPSGKTQHRLVALREPDISCFSAAQIAITEQVIDMLEGVNAQRTSDMTHDQIWEMAAYREEIPYETVFVSREAPKQSEIERGLSLAKDKRWNG